MLRRQTQISLSFCLILGSLLANQNANALIYPSTLMDPIKTSAAPIANLALRPVNEVVAINSNTSALILIEKKEQPAHRTIAPDNWEGLNRFTFKLNDKTDKILFVPLAKGYRKVTTGKMRKALRNFLSNLNTPVVLANDILQGQFKRAGKTTGRFIINTTIGFGGVADPAKHLGIEGHTEDFGQTLAVWGVPSGPYLVLPLFGPSTLRDAFGLGVDSIVLSPLNYIRTGAASKARLSRAGATLLATREPLIEPLQEIEANSLDYYSSFKSFYLQARRRDILNGNSALESLPDIGDGFDDFDDFDEIDDPDPFDGADPEGLDASAPPSLPSNEDNSTAITQNK